MRTRMFRLLGFALAGALGCALLNSQLCAQSAPPTFVYVNNNNAYGGNSVSAFSADSNGVLTPVPGSPFATGGTGSSRGLGTGTPNYASNGITASAVGNFLFVSDDVSNDIATFSIDPSTGVLTPINGSPFVYGPQEPADNVTGISLAVTPNGQYLYAGNSVSNDIWAFSIASDGALSPVSKSPLLTDDYPDGMNVTRDGNYLAVALTNSQGTGRVAMFSIGSGGALTAVTGSPFSTGGQAAYVDINCASNLLFASQAGQSAAVSVQTLTDGALSSIAGSPFKFSTNDFVVNSNVGVLSPNDQFLFVSNQFSNTIMSLNVAPGGALTEGTGSPYCNSSNSADCNRLNFGGSPSPTLMGTNQTGTLIYVANYNGPPTYGLPENTVTGFAVADNGTLTLLPGSPFDTGTPGFPSLTVFPPKACSVPLSITASSATMSYGGTTPTITPSYSGFVNGDTSLDLTTQPTCTTAAASNSPVGTYPSTCSSAVDEKYTIIYKPGTVTVSPATLTIAASSATMTYGSPVPTITPSYSGFVNGEMGSNLATQPICTTTAASNSPAGSYPSTCSGAVDGNYNISYLTGIVTVNQPSTTTSVKSSANPSIFDSSLTLTATVTSAGVGTPSGSITFKDGSTVLATVPINSAGQAVFLTSHLAVGSHTITTTYSGDSNFNGSTSAVLNQLVQYEPLGACDGSAGHQILQPINADGSSVYKQGRTVPAQFRVCDANGISIGTPGLVSSFFLTGIQSGTVTTSVDYVVDTNVPDMAFRWDPTGQQWIFNITTASLAAGSTYMYTIALNDGTTIPFQYGLR